MKNPNGYGCLKHLSGSRRNPWAFVVTENGKQKVKGYFPTKLEALAFQVEWNKSHNRHRLSKITFSELYLRWKPKHVEYFRVTESTVKGYESAYKHCTSLYDRAVEDIKYKDLQAVIDGMTCLSYASKKKVRNLLSLLFAYARKMEYTSRDFSGLIHIGRNKPVNPHHAISRRKINQLWKLVDSTPDVDLVLILIYTGLRNGELRALLKSDINRKQKYLRVTKSKTAAGIRTVPIHHLIWPLIEKRLESEGPYLVNVHGKPMDYSRFARTFKRVMRLVHGEKHKPHDTRHTCATLLDGAEVNDNARKMILGHARGDVTNGVYTHKTLRQLRKAIECL